MLITKISLQIFSFTSTLINTNKYSKFFEFRKKYITPTQMHFNLYLTSLDTCICLR